MIKVQIDVDHMFVSFFKNGPLDLFCYIRHIDQFHPRVYVS